MKIQNPDEVSRKFLKFVEGLRRKLYGTAERTKVSAAPDTEGVYANTNLADPDVADALMFEAWEGQAEHWLGIESEQTYKVTMHVLAERCLDAFKTIRSRTISNRPIKVLSLGCGPGVYEIFFAWWLKECGFRPTITCLDYSSAMIGCLNQILQIDEKIGGPVRPSDHRSMIRAVVGNMTDLSAFRHTDNTPGFDIVWINNSLQWCRDWKKVLQQATLTFKPEGLNKFFLVVHAHAMTLQVPDQGKARMPLIPPTQILDELERNGCNPDNLNIIQGNTGSGQNGARLSRSFITVTHAPHSRTRSWRLASPTTNARFFASKPSA